MTDKNIRFIQKTFSQVPATYELVNHILTFGLDSVWRKKAVQSAGTASGGQWADMCTGTGEMAVFLTHQAPKGTRIYAIDCSLPMLEEARKKPEAKNVCFVVSDVKNLSFSSASFDLVAISFATRNINLSKDVLIQSFAEIYRLLKPGGCFINLETSRPSSSLIRKLFHLYVKLFVKPIGSRVSGSGSAYAYLASTIPRFYSPEELRDILLQAGFDKVSFQRQMFGAVAIHRGIKL